MRINMEASELRIGNWVNVVYIDKALNAPREDVQVDAIVSNGINLEYGDAMYSFDDMNPIPLTEEWLVRFGFDKYICEFLKGGFKIEWDKKWRYFFQWYDITYIKHVHQLQNLYHSLTGEELEIKE
jgi:hypothetical protein